MQKKAIAILPARGGSKRIPRKNILDFHGKPAIGWPIQSARKSGCFDRIIVSTDDAEIAHVAKNLGAEVPFLRDPQLADDFTGTTDVIRDVVTKLNLPPATPVCLIYPTALFLSGNDIAKGKSQLTDDIDWVLSLGEYQTPIDRAYKMVANTGQVEARNPAKMPMRSQDLEPAFFDAGQFYWARAETWLDQSAHVWDGAASVVLPPEHCIDIDTPSDWRRAEHQFALFELEENAPSFSD